MLAVGTYFADESSDVGEAENENDKYVIGRYLFNAAQYANIPDATNYNDSKVQRVTAMIRDDRYKLGDFDRLAFEWAIHKGDSLYVLKGFKENNMWFPNKTMPNNPYQVWLTLTKEYGEEGKSIDFQKLIEWCTVNTFDDLYFPDGSQTALDANSPTFDLFKRTFRSFKDVAEDDKHSIGLQAIIALDDNTHKDWVFSFRTIDSDMGAFVIESETTNRDMLSGTMIEPEQGGWISVDNYGVPVIMRSDNFWSSGSRFILQKADGPSVNNEYIKTIADAASNVNVTGGKGSVTIHHAAGKKVMISNMLGQVIANSTVSSDISTVSVPSGIVIVSVEGKISVKVVVQ